MLVGKRPNYADIHFFDNVTKKFEWVKIGSDYENTAFDFSKDEAKFYGYVSMGSNSGIKKTFANRDLEITGGNLFGQERNGAGLRLFGEEVSSNSKGNAEIFIGSYGTDLVDAEFQIRHMHTNGVKDLLKIKAKGELVNYGKSTFLDGIRLARVDMDDYEEYGTGEKSGQMVYDLPNDKFKGNVNGAWHDFLTSDEQGFSQAPNLFRLARLATEPEAQPIIDAGGLIYYNTTTRKFRVNVQGTWKSLVVED